MSIESRRPPFATGQVVPDYGPLFKYWEIGGKDAREKTILNNEDFNYLRRLVEEQRASNLAELLNILEERFLPRVDPQLAQKALKEYYGYEFDSDYARRRIARILAGWLIEAGTTWKILKLKGWIPRD